VINMSPSSEHKQGPNIKAAILVDESGERQLDVVQGKWDVLGDHVDGTRYHVYSEGKRLVGILERRVALRRVDWVVQLWLGGPLDPRVAGILAAQLEADTMNVGFSWGWVMWVIIVALLLFLLVCFLLLCLSSFCAARRRKGQNANHNPGHSARKPLLTDLADSADNIREGASNVGGALFNSVGDGVKIVGGTIAAGAHTVGSTLAIGTQSVGDGLASACKGGGDTDPVSARSGSGILRNPGEETVRSQSVTLAPMAAMPAPASARSVGLESVASSNSASTPSSRPASIFSRIRGLEEPQTREPSYYHNEPR